MVPQRLLLIDDDDDCNTLVKFVLEQDTNWQILTANNGKEGIAIARSEHIDIILLDIVMPELNGLDVYKLLKSDLYTCTIPIIFMTAIMPIAPILKSQITDDVEVIIKPFDINKLALKIMEACEHYDLLSA